MRIDEIKHVAVIGLGTIGPQIAQLLSQAGGFTVSISDLNKELVDEGLQLIRSNLKKYFVDKGKITESSMKQIMDRIEGMPNQTDCVKGANFVIEAVPENIDLKKEVFRQLDNDTPPEVILATNTSGLNISEIANATSDPSRVVGMHFMNPVAVMRLVEVVKGPLTSPEVVDTTVGLAKKLNKEPMVCKDFSYGFLANRAYDAMKDEVIRMVWERVASPEEIDKALKLGYNLPMGPMELEDFGAGWAIRAASEPAKMKELGPERGHLHPLIRMMVRAGYTGGQGKKGIYDFYHDIMSQW